MWILGVTFIFHIILKKKVTPWIHRPTPIKHFLKYETTSILGVWCRFLWQQRTLKLSPIFSMVGVSSFGLVTASSLILSLMDTWVVSPFSSTFGTSLVSTTAVIGGLSLSLGWKTQTNYYVKRLLTICLLQLKLGYHKVLGTNRYTSFYPKMRYILFFYNHKIVPGFVYLKDFAGESIKLCYI